MAKKNRKDIPKQILEVYIAKTQTGYNKFERGIIAIDDNSQYTGCDYKPYNPESARSFYEIFERALEKKDSDIELHCRGNLTSLDDEHRLDGYWGRKEYIVRREIFLRNLTRSERAYLQKQFDKFSKKSSLKLKLVD